MNETRQFQVADLIAVVTGKMVTPRNTAGLHDVVEFVTGQKHMSHQLPRAVNETVKPELLRQHPWLANVEVGQVRSEADAVTYAAWAGQRYGNMHEVTALPDGAYVGREAYAELAEMNPNIIVLGDDAPDDMGGGPR